MDAVPPYAYGAMEAWRRSVLAAVVPILLPVLACAACGLDATGEVPLDGSIPGLDATGGTRDGSRDATTGHDAGLDATHRSDSSDAGPASDVAIDTTHPDVLTHDAAEASPGDDAPHDAGHDAEHKDATDKDVAEKDAAHDALSDAEHELDGAHDSGSDAPASDASGPPGFCVVEYGCGPSTCPCTQTCTHGECGACVPGWASCGLFTCGTQLSSTSNCGACGNACAFCPNFPYLPSCNKADGGYTCGC